MASFERSTAVRRLTLMATLAVFLIGTFDVRRCAVAHSVELRVGGNRDGGGHDGRQIIIEIIKGSDSSRRRRYETEDDVQDSVSIAPTLCECDVTASTTETPCECEQTTTLAPCICEETTTPTPCDCEITTTPTPCECDESTESSSSSSTTTETSTSTMSTHSHTTTTTEEDEEETTTTTTTTETSTSTMSTHSHTTTTTEEEETTTTTTATTDPSTSTSTMSIHSHTTTTTEEDEEETTTTTITTTTTSTSTSTTETTTTGMTGTPQPPMTRVSVTSSDSEVTASTTSPRECSANNLIVNGGFESPPGVIDYVTVPVRSLPAWQCSVFDRKIQVWSTGKEGVFSAVGAQHAMIQMADQVAPIYQQIAVQPGSYTWRISHRGRHGMDLINFAISDENNSIDYQQILSTGREWKTYSGLFEVSEPRKVRIALKPISAALNNGNFIDDVHFARNDCGTTSTMRTILPPPPITTWPQTTLSPLTPPPIPTVFGRSRINSKQRYSTSRV